MWPAKNVESDPEKKKDPSRVLVGETREALTDQGAADFFINSWAGACWNSLSVQGRPTAGKSVNEVIMSRSAPFAEP